MEEPIRDGKYIDFLTKMYNRFFLFHFFPQKLKEAGEKKFQVALFMIDLDNFKQVNDTYGHLAGDTVIENLAQVLRRSLRDNDYLIRYAGDEFIALLWEVNLETAYIIAERIMQNSRDFRLSLKDKTIIQTVSAGFALFPNDAGSLEELIERADESLYLVKKRKGRNNFAYFKEINVRQISSKIALNFFPCRRFINREKEWSIIKRGIEESKNSDKVKGTIVSSDSGMGKSRLLKRAAEFARGLGLEVISGGPSSQNALFSYALLSQALDSYLRNRLLYDKEGISSLLNELEGGKKDLLSCFIPSLKEILSSQPSREFHFPAKEEKRNILLISEGFLELLRAIAKQKGGLFLGIDNIQYSDLASLSFLNYLLERGKDLRVFLFLGILEPCPKDIPNPFALKDILKEIRGRLDMESVVLGPFSEKDTQEMVSSIFPDAQEWGGDFQRMVFDITKGHPFFIEEVLKYLVENSVIYYENSRWQIKAFSREALPSTPQEFVKERLMKLEPEIKESIMLASVMGENISPQLLSRVKGTEEGDVLEILDKAKRFKVIKEEGDGFSFSNDIMKEAALREIVPSQRKEISEKVSRALMDTYKDNIEMASFQLANIFCKSKDTQRIDELYKMVWERSSSILNSQEILNYLEDLISPQEQQLVVGPEIEEEVIPDVCEFLRLFQGALKDFILYPQESKIRSSVMDSVFICLKGLLERYETINIAEIEKSLVVNKRRIIPAVAKFVDVDNIVNFLMERDIKSISLIKGLTKEELDSFLNIVILGREDIYAQGQWRDILTGNGIRHISVNKTAYLAPQEMNHPTFIKDKLESTMMLDFIMGKLSGKDLASLNLISSLSDNPQLLSQKISQAAQEVKNKDKYADNIGIVSHALEKVGSLAEEGLKGALEPSEAKKALNKKLADVFGGLEPRVRSQLIRNAGPSGSFIQDILTSLERESVKRIVREAFSQGESLWSMKKLISQLGGACEGAGRKGENELSREIKDNLSSELERKFIEGMIEWRDMPLEKRGEDILKMSVKDLEEMSEEDMSSLIEELMLSQDYTDLLELFIVLSKRSLESSQKIGVKVRSVYIKIFRKLYSIPEKQGIVFVCLESLLSIIAGVDKEAFNFTMGLMNSIVNELNFYKFERKGELSKLKIFSALGEAMDSCQSYIGEKEISQWKEKFKFSGLTLDLFNLYMKEVMSSQELMGVRDSMFYFFRAFSGKLIESLSQKLSKSIDPFERFMLLRKLKDFLSSLKKEDLEKFTGNILESLPMGDIYDILFYAKREVLAEVLRNLYSSASGRNKENILAIIHKLNLQEASKFIEDLLGEDNPPDLQRQIKEVYNIISKPR